MSDTGKEIVCRCEEVSEEEILEAIQKGAHTQDAIKKLTRAGMGLCQGRTCRALIENILQERVDRRTASSMLSSCRPPVRPVSLADLAEGSHEPEETAEDGNI
jgi:NAD(P)H-nitrite reductase large subunit